MRGKWSNIFRDIKTGKWLIQFEVDEVSGYDELKDADLDISVKKHREKRSLDANAYAWVLMSKLAEIHGTSKEEVYESMLQKYGALDQDELGYITITMIDRIPIERVGGHWKFIGKNDGFNSYIMIKGSSEMDSKEMSVFIDGIVSECKEMGIETLPPDELERMTEQWSQ